jgi:hypothetical protein
MRRTKMLKPKNPKADKWKVVKAQVKGKNESFKPNFDYLFLSVCESNGRFEELVIKGYCSTISETGPISSIRTNK